MASKHHTQHTLVLASTSMACLLNVTLNRDVSATQTPACLATLPQECRRRLAQSLVFVGVSETQHKQGFQQPNRQFSGMPAFHNCSGAQEVTYKTRACLISPGGTKSLNFRTRRLLFLCNMWPYQRVFLHGRESQPWDPVLEVYPCQLDFL